MALFRDLYQGATISVQRKEIYDFLKENGQEDHPLVFEIDNSRYSTFSGFSDISLYSVKPENLDKLIKIADDGTSTGHSNLLKIRKYQNILQSYKTKIPKNLPDFADSLRTYVKNECFSYSLVTVKSDIPLFRRVISIDYNKGTKDGEPANVTVSMSYVSLNKKRSASIYLTIEDLQTGSTIEELLFKYGYRPMTQEDFDVYTKRYSLYKETFNKVGEQYSPIRPFICNVYGNYYSSRKIKISTASPLVIDTDFDYEKIMTYVDSTRYFNIDKSNEEILNFNSYNDCIIELFSLEDKERVTLNVEEITPYKWNDSILDEIVIPQAHRDCIDILLSSSSSEFEDVVRNKSKGIIVLASGVPGTGKTLTAQCWAESMHKPLYVVQASELGISIDKIEENIRNIFDRIIRWDAVLCLDEVDAFVHRRDTDLNQNAIVGVFLRMLETFSGILFMTTNRFKDSDGQLFIDDAIVSRVSAHIVYKLPDEEALLKILTIQATKMGLTVDSPEQIATFLKSKSCSGRDVRNFVKLAKMFVSKKKLSVLTLEDIKRVLPFHATLSIDAD